MIIKYKNNYRAGYNAIASKDQQNALESMEFGIIHLGEDDVYDNSEAKERAFLLIRGCVTLKYNDVETTINRASFLDENPVCLHVPAGTPVQIIGQMESELSYQAVDNEKNFAPKLYTSDDTITEEFGKGVMGDTALRRVRTIFDDSNAPYANMVLGEVINFPGRWSSYPAHHHCQPEIYHYRLVPEQGFGFSCEGDDAYKVSNRDTVVIEGGKVHPQVAAPGYAMYYIWTIPHTPKRWIKDREFLQKDGWLLEPNPIIWPDK